MVQIFIFYFLCVFAEWTRMTNCYSLLAVTGHSFNGQVIYIGLCLSLGGVCSELLFNLIFCITVFLNCIHTKNWKNFKLMYQLQDSRLLKSKYNSTVFTHIEIENHIFQNSKHKSHHLAQWKHWPSPGNTGLQNATTNYQ